MRYVLLGLILSSWHFSALARAEPEELTVVGSEFAYLYEKNPKGQAVGFAVDILNALAQRHGYRLRFEFYPWSRAQWMLERGQAHILVGPYKTPQREQKYLFSKYPFYRDQLVFYVRKSTGLKWNGDYAFLQNQRVAVIQGWVYGEEFERQRANFKPASVANLSIALNLLANNRYDFLAANVRNTLGALRDWTGPQEFQALEPIIQQQDGYLAYCKTTYCGKIWQEFELAYRELLQRGELQRWARAYPIEFPQ